MQNVCFNIVKEIDYFNFPKKLRKQDIQLVKILLNVIHKCKEISPLEDAVFINLFYNLKN